MKCAECPYYWAEENEKYPSCKYPYNDGYAPCEIEDQEKESEDINEDLGFDPYAGCYTHDC